MPAQPFQGHEALGVSGLGLTELLLFGDAQNWISGNAGNAKLLLYCAVPAADVQLLTRWLPFGLHHTTRPIRNLQVTTNTGYAPIGASCN